LRRRLSNCVTEHHGGLTPAAPDNDDRRSRRNRFPLQVRCSHPRRANTRRSCFRARRVYPNVCGIGVAGTFPEHHGGLTPAAPDRMCVCASQKSFSHWQTSASQYKSGGRKPPVANETSRGLMSACAGNLFPLRKNGGRQPPWVRCRHCIGVREHTAGSLLRVCGGAFAIALR
jgi:hypothetical protein